MKDVRRPIARCRMSREFRLRVREREGFFLFALRPSTFIQRP